MDVWICGTFGKFLTVLSWFKYRMNREKKNVRLLCHGLLRSCSLATQLFLAAGVLIRCLCTDSQLWVTGVPLSGVTLSLLRVPVTTRLIRQRRFTECDLTAGGRTFSLIHCCPVVFLICCRKSWSILACVLERDGPAVSHRCEKEQKRDKYWFKSIFFFLNQLVSMSVWQMRLRQAHQACLLTLHPQRTA